MHRAPFKEMCKGSMRVRLDRFPQKAGACGYFRGT